METGVGIIFTLFGLGSTVVSVLFFYSVIRKLRTWQTIPGTVLGYREDSFEVRKEGTKKTYTPQVQFRAENGKLITFYSSTGSSKPPYRVGAMVNVLCPPDDPEKATLKSFSNLGIFPLFALFFGVTFSAIGLDLIFGR